MESLNSWSKGMVKDNSTLSQSKDSYLNAENLSLITLSGQSNFTIENVKGNSLSATLPDTSAIYRFVGDSAYTAASLNEYTIDINGEVYITGSVTGGLVNLAYLINNYAPYIALGFQAELSEDEETLYLIALDDVLTTDPSIVITATIGLISGYSYVPARTNLIPIGFTTIRDDIYIISTDCVTANPAGVDPSLASDAISYGQIWKLTYDKSTLATTLTLIYNANLNLTTQHPIPPTAILGIYETINTQRIYWTDNFNKPRSINVRASNLFGLNPVLTNSQPDVLQSIPILSKINTGGDLLIGTYQAAYRLSKSGGATSGFSQLSNQVYIVNDLSESTTVNGTSFKEYVSDVISTDSNKSITWFIDNLDTNYDTIELAVAYRETLNGSVTVQIVKSQSFSGDSISLTYTGSETNITTISLSDLTLSPATISKAKTLGTKDKRLLLGNLQYKSKLLNDYDTRAYRFVPSGDI